MYGGNDGKYEENLMVPMIAKAERKSLLQACGRLTMSLVFMVGLTGFTLVLATPASAADQESVGSVKSVEGAAFVVSKGTRSPATLDLRIYQNDVLVTEAGGAMGVTFNDDTMISIGPESELTIDEYVFNPSQSEYSFVTKLARGTLFFISGVMSKLAPESSSVKTPGGVIAVRGTRFLVRLEQS